MVRLASLTTLMLNMNLATTHYSNPIHVSSTTNTRTMNNSENEVHRPDNNEVEVIDPRNEGAISANSEAQVSTIHQPPKIQNAAIDVFHLAVVLLLHLHTLLVQY